MRERDREYPCHLVRNYNRAAHNNRARPRPRVIYPSHPESDRANGPRIETDGDAGARGSGTRFCLSLAPRFSFPLALSFAGQPWFRGNAHPISSNGPSRNCGVKPHIGDAECRGCRGTDRIGLPCGLRRYLRSIISGIYRCRRQPRAVLRPARANDIP